jgi:small ligand-binding sensory domain FIST
MTTFRTALSTHAESSTAVQQCLEQLGRVPRSANLGFIYASDHFADPLDSMVSTLQRATQISDWVGSVGIGICYCQQELYETPALAIMLGEFPQDSFRVFDTIRQDLSEFVARQQDWYRCSESHFGIVHGDPQNGATPQLIEQLSETLPGGYLVGGLTSSNTAHHQIANGITEGGISGVIFSAEVPVATGLTQGCSPIGGKHLISEAERNILVSLDNRPALEVFNEDIGEVLARDLNRVSGYIFAGLPIPGSDTGDYLVRNLLGIDTHNELIAIGDLVEPGEQIMFCRRDGQSATEDLSRMLDNLTRRTHAPVKGAVYYSCLGRGRYLFGVESEELKMIQETLGNVPLVGFFANGEISHRRLYGYTGVLTLFM